MYNAIIGDNLSQDPPTPTPTPTHPTPPNRFSMGLEYTHTYAHTIGLYTGMCVCTYITCVYHYVFAPYMYA